MKKSLLLFSILSLVLTGCSLFGTSDQNLDVANSAENTAQAPIKVVASFYPLAFMAEQIGGDNATILNLAGSVDVHAYEPSAQDMVNLNKADLVIFQGADLEPWTDGVIAELAPKGVATLEVSHDLSLAKMEAHEDHGDHEDPG